MMGRQGHLKDERLHDCYLAEQAGDSADPSAAQHLADCRDCADRYTELSRFLEALRSQADADIDALFPPERMQSQRQQIASRLAHVGHSARVISFPVRLVRHHMTAAATRITPRLAAAAAAGLLVGVALGMFYNSPWRPPAAAPPFQAAQSAPPSAPAPMDADLFLSTLDLALGGPRSPELEPFDVLTPHVREIVAELR